MLECESPTSPLRAEGVEEQEEEPVDDGGLAPGEVDGTLSALQILLDLLCSFTYWRKGTTPGMCLSILRDINCFTLCVCANKLHIPACVYMCLLQLRS